MQASEHSTKVDDWLTRAEALVLESTVELAYELEQRGQGYYLRTSSPLEAANAARVVERAKALREAATGLLIVLRVYFDSTEAGLVLDSERCDDEATS